MNDRILKELSERLTVIVKLLALSVGEGKPQRERIRILWGVGLVPKQIAEILGTTPNTVRVEISQLRRRSRTYHGQASIAKSIETGQRREGGTRGRDDREGPTG